MTDELRSSSKNRSNFSQDETDLIDETFNIIRNLNKDIEKVEGQKKKLEKDISSLSKKVSSPPPKKVSQPMPSPSLGKDVLSEFKKEILDEIEPLFLSYASKVDSSQTLREVTKVVDKEFVKLKKEFENERNKDKRTVAKKFSTMEERIIDSLKSNEKLQKSLKKFEHKLEGNVADLFEKRLQDALDKTSKKFVSLYNASIKEIEDMKALVKLSREEMDQHLKTLNNLQKDINLRLKEGDTELVSFDSKLTSIQKETESLKKLIGKFEDDLYTKKEKEINQLIGQFKRSSTLIKQKIEDFDLRASGQEELMLTQLNKMVDKINELDQRNITHLDREGKKLQEFLKKISEKTKADAMKVKDQSISLTKKERDKITETFNFFKKELISRVDTDIESLSQRLEELGGFEAEKDKLLAKKVAEITKEHSKDIDEIVDAMHAMRKELTVTTKHLSKNLNDEFAKSQAQLSEELMTKFDQSKELLEEVSVKEAEKNAEQIITLATELRSELTSQENALVELIEEKTKALEELKEDLQSYLREHETLPQLKQSLKEFYSQELSSSLSSLEHTFTKKFSDLEYSFEHKINNELVEPVSGTLERIQGTHQEILGLREKLEVQFQDLSEKSAEEMITLATELRSELDNQEIKLSDEIRNLYTHEDSLLNKKLDKIESSLSLQEEKLESAIMKDLKEDKEFLLHQISILKNQVEIVEQHSETSDDLNELKVSFEDTIADTKNELLDYYNSRFEQIEVQLISQSELDTLRQDFTADLDTTKQIILEEVDSKFEQNIPEEFDSTQLEQSLTSRLDLLREELLAEIEDRTTVEDSHFDSDEFEEKITFKLEELRQELVEEIQFKVQEVEPEHLDVDSIKEEINTSLDSKLLELKDELSSKSLLQPALTEEIETKLSKVDELYDKISEMRNGIDEHFVKQAEENADQIVTLATELREQLDRAEQASFSHLDEKTSEFDSMKAELQEFVEQKLSAAMVLKEGFESLAEQVNTYGSELESQEELVIDKVNEVIDLQERSLKALYAKVEQSKDEFGDHFSHLEESFNKKLDDLVKRKAFSSTDAGLDDILNQKKEIISLVESKEKEFNLLHKKFSTLIEGKEDELSDLRQTLVHYIDEKTKHVDDVQELLEKKVEASVQSFEHKMASQFVKNNELLSKIEQESKEQRRDASEEMEKRFFEIKGQFEGSYSELISKFDIELKRKEQEYLEKILLIEKEKEEAVRNFSAKISEVSSIQKEFDKEKEEFEKLFEQKVSSSQQELEIYTQSIKDQLAQVVAHERESFEYRESSFKDLFTEKVDTLHDFYRTRIDKLERKFLEKNHKLFEDTIKQHVDSIEATKDSVQSSLNVLEEREQLLENKTQEFFENLKAERINFEQHLDGVFKEHEKKISKRLLGFDADFNQFKGVIIEEVNSLMKDMKTALTSKSQPSITAAGKTELQAVEGDIRSLWKEHSELKSRINNISSFNPQDGMNAIVGGLVDYENSLVSLVESLKRRGVSDETIKDALANKGHPRLYVSMILQTL